MQTRDLIQNAIDKKFTSFDSKTKEILSAKIAQKLQEKGYFARLDKAKAISEGSYEFNKLVYLSINQDGQDMATYAYEQLEEYAQVLDWVSKKDNHYALVLATDKKWVDKLLSKTGTTAFDTKYVNLKETLSTGMTDYGSPVMDTNDFYKWIKTAKTK